MEIWTAVMELEDQDHESWKPGAPINAYELDKAIFTKVGKEYMTRKIS